MLFVKCGIHIIDVFLIHFVFCETQTLAESLEVNDFPRPQELDGIIDIRVVGETEDIVIGDAGLLFWCDCVRTTFLPFSRFS